MAGIYLHIPFCRSRCIYCGFYSTTQLEWRQRYVDALCREMAIRRFFIPESMGIDTVYFGGGTPSQLTVEQLKQLFIYINKVYGSQFSNHQDGKGKSPEITIEVNPDDVTEEFAEALKELPVNRVSMGAQTFDDERLRFLKRRHTAEQVRTAVKRLREAGIRNISIDLIYGFPGETLDDWQRDIDAALALEAVHLSAYCLMIEEGTPLYQQVHKGDGSRCVLCDEELERQMYETLIDRLTAAGYEHYEISNFARPGFRSRHNSSYWTGIPYIGLGAAAHTYDGKGRQWNVADIRQYMEGIESGTPCFEREELDEDTHYNDTVTVALRTREGICLDNLSKRHRLHFMECARKYIDSGLLQQQGNRVSLTRSGLFVSDMVMSDLMLV